MVNNPLKFELHRAWTEQIYKEYDNILYWHRVSLRPPVIRIKTLSGKWGMWDPNTRTITISRALIEKHPWDIVIEILKHEMAHQMVTEHFSDRDVHGQDFRKACEKLGVADWAAQASGDLPEKIPSWREKAYSHEEERLLKKVEKLLALATSNNEHEALAAMKRVQEIYSKHHLKRLAERITSKLVYSTLCRKRKRIETAESMIFSILAEHFLVRVIYGNLFDPADLSEYRMVELLGTRENVLMAEYVHGFLWNKIHSLWNDYKKSSGRSGRSKNSYLMGVLSGFREKLATHQKDVWSSSGIEKKECMALVARGDVELNRFVDSRHPRLSGRYWGAGRRDASSFSAGKEDGKKITLHRGITQREETIRLLTR